jgi:CHASE3 domain sensor protein
VPKQTATRSDPMNSSSLVDDARDLWGEVRGLSQDRFKLAALETQQAGVSLVNMIIAGVLVAVLLCGERGWGFYPLLY